MLATFAYNILLFVLGQSLLLGAAIGLLYLGRKAIETWIEERIKRGQQQALELAKGAVDVQLKAIEAARLAHANERGALAEKRVEAIEVLWTSVCDARDQPIALGLMDLVPKAIRESPSRSPDFQRALSDIELGATSSVFDFWKRIEPRPTLRLHAPADCYSIALTYTTVLVRILTRYTVGAKEPFQDWTSDPSLIDLIEKEVGPEAAGRIVESNAPVSTLRAEMESEFVSRAAEYLNGRRASEESVLSTTRAIAQLQAQVDFGAAELQFRERKEGIV